MEQVQITKGRSALRARRRLERESILPFDPRDPGITQAKWLQRQASGRAEHARRGRSG
jgi:hypothetical protein